MDSKTYIANAIKTESIPASLTINQIALHALLESAIIATQLADQVKRRLFYGQEIDHKLMQGRVGFLNGLTVYLHNVLEAGGNLNVPMTQEELIAANLPEGCQNMQLENLDVRLLHSALGCFTESGELLEAMKAQFETGVLDRVNFGEEVGDIEWYQAIGFDASGVSEAHCREKNIAKLQKRYPDKFTSEAALNRDLAGERAVLEGNQTILPGGGLVHPVAAGA